eukprot:TRINITY_DN11314_c0_g1_i11.p1 TRINITY_DN11314_c0_g1~~TRINITY_DN11314_c0_g1_i11.p1  ORF type:complete len:280 (-),score=33.86 TRINITY_DN11314_c0_g1_i11:18-857(-)
MTVADTNLTCDVPSGSGMYVPVCVSRDGQTDCKDLISYTSPVITAQTLRLNSGSPSISGNISKLQLSSFSSQLIQFDGIRFLQGLETEVNITYGPLENPKLFLCSFTTPGNVTATTARCATSSVGLGGPLRFFLTSKSITSNIGADGLYYPPPTITNNTLGLGAHPLSTSSRIQSNTTEGEVVTFNGTNFGTNLAWVRVSYGPPANRTLYQCTVQTVTTNSITCTTQAGQGDDLPFTVFVGPGSAVQNVTGPLRYGYPPEIGRAVQQECRDRSRMPSSA